MFLLKIIFTIFLLLLPLGEIARLQLKNSIAFTLNDILLAITILTSIFLIILKKNVKKSFSTPLLKPIVFFVGVGFLSLVINSSYLNQLEFLTSFFYLLRWMAYASLYFIVLGFDQSFKKKISQILIFSAILLVFVGYVQYFLYPNLRNLYYLGWDEHLYRMFSSFLDPNFAGTFFVLFLIFITGRFYSLLKKKQDNASILLGLISLFTFLAIFLTYSRSALVALFAGIISFLFLINKKKLILGILITFILIIFLSPKAFQTEGTNLLRTASSKARLDSAEHAITIFKENPIIGVGFNAYRYAQYRYGFLKGENWQETHAGAGTDNSFLFLLATTGILGLVSYLYILRKMMLKEDPMLKSSIIALIVSSFFVNCLFYTFIMEWVWILIALRKNN